MYSNVFSLLLLIKKILNMIINHKIPHLRSFLFGSFGGSFFGSRGTSYLTIGSVVTAIFLSLIVFYTIGLSVRHCLSPWINADLFNVSWKILFGTLTVTILVVVTCISCLVHVYSTEYIKEDPHLSRFLGYLSLFTFFMLILVCGDNFIPFFLDAPIPLQFGLLWEKATDLLSKVKKKINTFDFRVLLKKYGRLFQRILINNIQKFIIFFCLGLVCPEYLAYFGLVWCGWKLYLKLDRFFKEQNLPIVQFIPVLFAAVFAAVDKAVAQCVRVRFMGRTLSDDEANIPYLRALPDVVQSKSSTNYAPNPRSGLRNDLLESEPEPVVQSPINWGTPIHRSADHPALAIFNKKGVDYLSLVDLGRYNKGTNLLSYKDHLADVLIERDINGNLGHPRKDRQELLTSLGQDSEGKPLPVGEISEKVSVFRRIIGPDITPIELHYYHSKLGLRERIVCQLSPDKVSNRVLRVGLIRENRPDLVARAEQEFKDYKSANPFVDPDLIDNNLHIENNFRIEIWMRWWNDY
jgi:NADH-Ubiquinone oxidoreductase (complex I), chain 5 N-terminus